MKGYDVLVIDDGLGLGPRIAKMCDLKKQKKDSKSKETNMDRTGISDAVVLAALYNSARVQGMGILQARPGEMTPEQAEKLLKTDANPDYSGPRRENYFDYLYGRVIKTDVSANPLHLDLYDRDNGRGAGEKAVLEFATRPGAPR